MLPQIERLTASLTMLPQIELFTASITIELTSNRNLNCSITMLS